MNLRAVQISPFSAELSRDFMKEFVDTIQVGEDCWTALPRGLPDNEKNNEVDWMGTTGIAL